MTLGKQISHPFFTIYNSLNGAFIGTIGVLDIQLLTFLTLIVFVIKTLL